jgi:hypothetical protein
MAPKQKVDVAFTSETLEIARDVLDQAGIHVDKIVTLADLQSEAKVKWGVEYADIFLLQPLQYRMREHVNAQAIASKRDLRDRATNIWV